MQDEIKKISLKKEVSTREKEQLNAKITDKKLQENKCTIILDNIGLKLGVKNKADIVNVLKSKLEYLKTHNMQKYLELMGQNVEQQQQMHAWMCLYDKRDYLKGLKINNDFLSKWLYFSLKLINKYDKIRRV